MKKIKQELDIKKELNLLHSGIMAIEEILVKKGIISLNELNKGLKKTCKEVKLKRMKGSSINVGKRLIHVNK